MTHSELRRIAGKLIMICFPGTVLDAATAEFIKENGIRGVCLFRDNMIDSAPLSILSADLRDVMSSESLIAIDQAAAVGRMHRRSSVMDLPVCSHARTG